MRQPGAILIPLLTGFLLTVGVVSWRSGWWQQRDAAAAPPRVEVRPPYLRIVQVKIAAAAAARNPLAPAASAPAAPAALPQPSPETSEVPPVPRVDPGNSPELLGAPERKFARGSHSGGD